MQVKVVQLPPAHLHVSCQLPPPASQHVCCHGPHRLMLGLRQTALHQLDDLAPQYSTAQPNSQWARCMPHMHAAKYAATTAGFPRGFR